MDQELWAKRIQGIQPFVAEWDGSIVGYADVQANGYIDHFFVSGGFSRQGVGRALMARIHAVAAQRQLVELTSEVSLTAQPFFAHFGFQVAAHQSVVRRGVVLSNARMRKDLATGDPTRSSATVTPSKEKYP